MGIILREHSLKALRAARGNKVGGRNGTEAQRGRSGRIVIAYRLSSGNEMAQVLRISMRFGDNSDPKERTGSLRYP